MFSSVAIELGGFVLLHALWIVSDLPTEDSLAPFAICETVQGRELIHFESDTQARAIADAKKFLAQPPAQFLRCAFVRDGRAPSIKGYVDVLSVTIWERNMAAQITFSQFYRPPSLDTFSLLGPIQFTLGVETDLPGSEAQTIQRMIEGMSAHQPAFPKWTEWKTRQLPAPVLVSLEQ